jgi:hypothetical protein
LPLQLLFWLSFHSAAEESAVAFRHSVNDLTHSPV